MCACLLLHVQSGNVKQRQPGMLERMEKASREQVRQRSLAGMRLQPTSSLVIQSGNECVNSF